ncbi:hypothetical protein JOE38_000969 [Clavibacter michiganensis]|uniref:hypothetical protein n=1 Tax=Clavibacter michiganensis TaxID=28447 RepID=UPI00195EA82E|nr:hypothetical protein [Clavibacter michiganensis]MBM7411146.1 hypothetical protein [Clavibacter michiganensis]
MWGLTLLFLVDYDFAVSVFGELALTNPVVIVILHSPAIAALAIFALYDGPRGVANFLRTLVPRRSDLPWLAALMGIMVAYIFGVRYIGMLFGISMPPEPLAPVDMVLTFLSMFIGEVGMLAITVGWYGFFMPFMNRVTGSHVLSGIATGVGIGVFVAPGNLFSSFELATAWPIYVAQLCVLSIGMSMLISKGKGNVLFFLLPFWVSASGSWLDLYYFNTPTQLVQLALFSMLVLVLWFVLRRQSRRELDAPFTFPEYLERDYTVQNGVLFEGKGDRSREGAELAGVGAAAAPPSSGSGSTDADPDGSVR